MEFFLGADTGTYLSFVLAMVTPDPAPLATCFVLEEFPNYRYVGGEIELTGESLASIATRVLDAWTYYTGKTDARAWADPNTQFAGEFAQYRLHLLANSRKLEFRTEAARTYFSANRIALAPWLDILPYELEEAHFPDETTSAGQYVRIKRNDHTLDCLEHILSRKPRGKVINQARKPGFLEQHFHQHKTTAAVLARPDPHLGRAGMNRSSVPWARTRSRRRYA